MKMLVKYPSIRTNHSGKFLIDQNQHSIGKQTVIVGCLKIFFLAIVALIGLVQDVAEAVGLFYWWLLLDDIVHRFIVVTDILC